MEEKTVQREDVLGEAIQILEIEGIANTTLEMGRRARCLSDR
ncbi:HTH-type transcriptional regulator yjdC [Raoultella terrigena]|uniref:HTH-type transcriptional regulator yjdC n=1 Tax=Raoultella terrigena TaxID=577 RepID=A0A4U9DBM4_RAOTE|nr:HTH-type transcriptional regulator yjdC [Raoultella terrigena]